MRFECTCNIDLARAKSEALDNIYSLLKQNIKSTIGLISKKATLHAQHTFFVHFFAVVFHDYDVKLPETS